MDTIAIAELTGIGAEIAMGISKLVIRVNNSLKNKEISEERIAELMNMKRAEDFFPCLETACSEGVCIEE